LGKNTRRFDAYNIDRRLDAYNIDRRLDAYSIEKNNAIMPFFTWKENCYRDTNEKESMREE
jgi:hypothetical protein